MALGESDEVGRSDVFDRSFINYTGGDAARLNEVAQPLGGVGVELVIVGGHASTPPLWNCHLPPNRSTSCP
jgi:hypothetical protein